mgnify:CR=1 FL=1
MGAGPQEAAFRRGVDVIVGTQALLYGNLTVAKLGLVVIDEQHKFGVLQRKTLIDKGYKPDVLVLTATPIPRTLAMTIYGDLDVSIIDEMPPGRTPVSTQLLSKSEKCPPNSGEHMYCRAD